MTGLQVLGGLRAEVNGRPVDLGSPLQRSVLAMLTIGRRRTVSVDRMIDQLWRGEPPPRATASLQAYVSNLRRLLEPGRPPRSPARVLVSEPPGYALRLPDGAVDAWRFEETVRRARSVPPRQAGPMLAEALGWWRGPAYAEVADQEWAAAEIARLTELRTGARELAAAVAVRDGRAADALSDADALTWEMPLREEGWRLLALALWACDRRADALDALRRSRRLFAAELGLDPSPALARLEQDILRQRTDVLHAITEPAPVRLSPSPEQTGTPDGFVGRDAELGVLTGPPGRVVLVSGEAGLGKTRLLEVAAQRLGSGGWTVLLGRCPDHDGAPPAWAWVEALRGLAAIVPPADPAALAPLLRADGPPDITGDAARSRFLLHRAVERWLDTALARAPIALVLDDLHRADAETLALLEHIAVPVRPGMLVIAAHRPEEGGDRLAEALGVLARVSPERIALKGLAPDSVGALASAVSGVEIDAYTVAALAERTGGNPFYVRESARLLAGEGRLAAVSQVPQGVRDVLRRRLDRLPASAVGVLRTAAVAGREAEVDVLIAVHGGDEEQVLDGLDAGLVAGLLSEPAPGLVRFTHALVQDTIYTDLSGARRTRMHARLADILRRLRPGDLSALAHHHLRGASAATVDTAVDYAVRAADLAERRYAYDSAMTLREQAVDVFDRLSPGAGEEHDDRLTGLLTALLRAQLQAGSLGVARSTWQRIIGLGEMSGRDDLIVAALVAWSEPLPWQNHAYGFVDRPVVAALEKQLARPDLPPEVRCRLLGALVSELAGDDRDRVLTAAAEQLDLARGIGDPVLLAAALASSAKPLPFEWDADRRSPLIAELRSLAETHTLPAYLWVCEHVDGIVACVRGDTAALRRHLTAGLALARRYRMVEQEAANIGTLAMLDHVAGRFDEAEAGYADARDRQVWHGSFHAAPAYAVAAATVALGRGDYERAEPLARALYDGVGALAGDLLAVALIGLGRTGEARALRRDAPLNGDHAHSIRVCLRAEVAMALDEHDRLPELLPLLEPMRDQLAGAASSVVAMRPVAHVLGDVYRALGDERRAAAAYRQAVAVAERWGAPHWAEEARSRL